MHKTSLPGAFACAVFICLLSHDGTQALPIPIPATEPASFVTPGATGDFRRDPDVTRSGNASLHVRNNGCPTERESGHTAAFMFDLEALPLLTYTVEAWVKTGQVAKSAGLIARPMSNGGFMEMGQNTEWIGAEQDWTRVKLVCSPPAGATSIKVFLYVRGHGEAWFDGLEIRDDFEQRAPKAFAALDKGLAAAASARIVSVEKRRSLFASYQRLEELLLRGRRDVQVQEASEEMATLAGGGGLGYIVGSAPSTVRVFPEDRPFQIKVSNEVRLVAVRGERESFQLVIVPLEKGLVKVNVSVSDLSGGEGMIPSSAVTIWPVGCIKITRAGSSPHPQDGPYYGWWPDPLLPNFPFDIDERDTQAVWISVRVPRVTPAGLYRGTLTIDPLNAPRWPLMLKVEVADVELPEQWHFRNLLCFDDGGYGPNLYGGLDGWERVRDKFNDFLLDHRINLGGLSGQTQKRLSLNDMIDFARRGQNVIFLYQFAWDCPMTNRDGSPLTELPGKIHEWMRRLKAAGFADRGIVYGWDERGPEAYPAIRTAAELLARDYPGLPLLMAGVDEESYGTDSLLNGLSNIVFCPGLERWNAALAGKAKANGNKLWWYTCYWNIEQKLIRSRLIPWQTYKVGADGFLIWSMNRWLGNAKCLSGHGIRTDWNPWLDGVFANSTAMCLYPGENGPISSLRLENFADGIEDYDLLMLGREMVGNLETQGHGTSPPAERLRLALTIEDRLVKDGLIYSTDAQLLEAHRRRLIEALDGLYPLRH